MGSYQANLPDLVVAASALTATSNIVTGFDDAQSITITAPATLTNTHHVQVNASPTAATASSGWATASNASGTNVTIAAGGSATLTGVSFASLRVSSLGTEAAARTFTATKQFAIGQSSVGSGSVGILGASGTINALPKWSTGTVLTDSLLTDNGTNVTLASGQLLLPDGVVGAPGLSFSGDPTTGFFRVSGNIVRFSGAGTGTLQLENDGISLGPNPLRWAATIGGTKDVILIRDAANTLALRNSTAAQTQNIYQTYTSASDYVRTAIVAGTATTSIAIQGAGATGASANRDLALTTLGSGILVIGNATNSAGAQTGTLTNSPVSGNPATWLAVSVGGNVRYIPCF